MQERTGPPAHNAAMPRSFSTWRAVTSAGNGTFCIVCVFCTVSIGRVHHSAITPPCVPLMASMTIGWAMAVVGFAFFVYSIVGWLFGDTRPGWTSLMAAVGLLGGMQFLMLGIIGAYLGRLYNQSKGRPLFLIRDIVGRDR